MSGIGDIAVTGGTFTRTGQFTTGADTRLTMAADPGTQLTAMTMPRLAIPYVIAAHAAGTTIDLPVQPAIDVGVFVLGFNVTDTCRSPSDAPPLPTITHRGPRHAPPVDHVSLLGLSRRIVCEHLHVC